MALLSRLFMLVAVALLPAIAIQSYNEFELRHSRQMEVQERRLVLLSSPPHNNNRLLEGFARF